MRSREGSAPGAPNYRVEALAKGLRILSLFSPARPAMRVKDIVAELGLPMPTVFRLVATLEQEGYLERTSDGAVRPGTGVLAFGFAALQGLDLVQTSAATLQELADETGATVNLGVLSGDQVLVVARIQARPTPLAANVRIGSLVPAVFSSMGKAMLAHLPEADFDERITEESFSREWGPKAVRSLPALREQLETVRRDGFIMQEEEAIPGLSSVAAPIREVGGDVIAALNVAVSSVRYDRPRLTAELLDPVLRAAERITLRLGG